MVSKNVGTPKSSILVEFPLSEPSSYWGTPIYGIPQIGTIIAQSMD